MSCNGRGDRPGWRTGAAWVGVLLIFALHAFYLRGVAEDAFITFRFARHLAAGEGLVWNIGEHPVEGYTNFLWLVLCAVSIRAGFDVVLVSQVAGVLAAGVTMGATYRFAHRALGLSERLAFLPVLMLALAGPFATWATSGMETSLFGMLLLIAGGQLAAWARSWAPAHLVAASVTALLATLTRPEGFLAFCVFAIAAALHAWLRRRRVGWRELLPLALYIVPLGLYVLWRYSYFGFLLPNTFYAKTGGSVFQYLRGVKYVGLFALHFVVLPFAPLLIARFWRGASVGGRPDAAPPRRFATGLAVGLIGSFSVYLVYVGGDYMAMYRFIVPILPFLYLVLAVVLSPLWSSSVVPSRQAVVVALVVVVAGLTAVHSTPLEARLFPKPEFMHGTHRGVEYERRYVARFTVIGRFFQHYKCRDTESIALEPIGAIPYYSGLIAHSAHGIVDPVIAHKPFTDRVIGTGFPGHEKIDWLHAISKRPTYILFSRHLGPRPELFPRYPEPIDTIVRGDYELRWAWLDDPRNRESGYFTFLELRGARRLDC